MHTLERPLKATLPSSPGNAHRFETLDALRGLAALTVVQMHLPFLFAAHMPFPHAYLAVDFFFMLSGFVLNYAYGSRLSQGWSTVLFLRDRVFRLYPLYLLGLPLGLAHLLYTNRRDQAPLHHGEIIAIVIFALINFPLPSSIGGMEGFFPTNGPSWSLFYELVANLAHGLFFRYCSRAKLTLITCFAGLLLIPISVQKQGLNIGFLRGEFFMGLVRVTFSYTFGMLLLDLWKEGRLRRFRSFLGSAILLAAVLLSPVLSRGNGLGDLAAVFFVFPAVLLLAANATSSSYFMPLVTLLGTLSYPVYVLHVPVYSIFTALWGVLLKSKTADHAPVSGIVYMLFLLAICYLLERFYDLPVRRLLRRYTKTARSPT